MLRLVTKEGARARSSSLVDSCLITLSHVDTGYGTGVLCEEQENIRESAAAASGR